MHFRKMHGLGNDFIVVDARTATQDDLRLPEARIAELAIRLCDRHFGVGADGLILVTPSQPADFRMRLINSDGSEASHCGNGIRCVARFLRDTGLWSADAVRVETVGRVNVLEFEGTDGRVRVDMGCPGLTRREIPVQGEPESRLVDEPFETGGVSLRLTGVSMGNPHVVSFLERDPAEFPVTEIGPLVERHPWFPDRTNVEFIQILAPDLLKMRVWERGAGETLACGTGACAAVVAGALTGRTARRATVRLLGGDLEIDWAQNGRVYMTGPAETAFVGDVDPDAIELP